MNYLSFVIPLVIAAWPAVAHGAGAKPGIEVLVEEQLDLVRDKRVGLLTNPSAVDSQLVPTLDRLRKVGVEVTQLYAPEHGISAALANGKGGEKGIDPGSGLPLEPVWGAHFAPSQESLARIDVLVFDIQDLGSRTYTFATTLGKLMIAAGAAGKTVIVLDRPNPGGGLLFEGPMMEQKHKSLVGWGPLPVTYGMTLGELARFYKQELNIKVDLKVVPMKGWRRDMVWEDTGLPWVPSSPGIPHELNAHLYVATGMVGGCGANVNEGGGNSMPFELIGAPYIDPQKLADCLRAENLPGVLFRPMSWKPRAGAQFAGKLVHGVQLVLTNPRIFRPLKTALAILADLYKLFPEAVQIQDLGKFGRVWGTDRVLTAIKQGIDWRKIEESWQPDLAVFALKRQKALLYP